MNTRWHTATECHYVLSSFLADIKRKGSTVNPDIAAKRESMTVQDEEADRISSTPSPKRQRTSIAKAASRNKQDEKAQPNVASDPFANEPRRPSSQTGGKTQPNRSSSFDIVNDPSNAQFSTSMPPNWFGGAQPAQSWANQPPVFASAYSTDPQGLPFQTPEVPAFNSAMYDNDPTYWNNFNYNMDDVFESAIFENLPGQYNPPMASGWDP